MTDIKDMSPIEKEELVAELEEHIRQVYEIMPINPFKLIPEEIVNDAIECESSMFRTASDKEVAKRAKELLEIVNSLRLI